MSSPPPALPDPDPDLSESEPDPTLSAASSPARSTSSWADSLAGQHPDEVERVALDFISNPPASDHEQLVQLGGGLDAFDLPRAPTSTLTRDEVVDLEKKALEFLKRKVLDADRDDWMYPTPAVFGAPKPLGLRNASGTVGAGAMAGPERGREREEGVGWDDKDGNGPDWVDRAFNLERYQVEGLSGTLHELDLAAVTTTTTDSNDFDPPPRVEDWQGRASFGDTLDEGGYPYAG